MFAISDRNRIKRYKESYRKWNTSSLQILLKALQDDESNQLDNQLLLIAALKELLTERLIGIQ